MAQGVAGWIIVLMRGWAIQSKPRHRLTCNLDLLCQQLLILQNLLHNLVTQIHLRFQTVLIGINDLHTRE